MSTSEFQMYTDNVSGLGGNISDYASRYITKIEETTAIVNNLSAVWGGPTYDTFKAGYDSKLGGLEELNNVLKNMANRVEETSAEGETMINQINSQVE